MSEDSQYETMAKQMRASFEADLPARIERAKRIQTVNIVPEFWFTRAASECVQMYIDGVFYGAISVAQAYVEAISRFLVTAYHLRMSKNVKTRLQRLQEEGKISTAVYNAGLSILSDRNDFHHLNSGIETDYHKLEERCLEDIKSIYIIDSEIFAHSISNGKIIPENRLHWPRIDRGKIKIFLRNIP